MLRIISGIIILIVLAISWWYKNSISTTTGQLQDVISPNAKLSYTQHAKCRMQCRNITEYEIREVLKEGVLNLKKSDLNDKPCPTYAIEDRVQDGTRLRIVFGKCNNQIKVITCIDLDQNFDCDCN